VSAKARWLFRLYGLLALAGLAVALAALAVAVRATTITVPPIDQLATACRSWLLPQGNVPQLLVVLLALLGITAITRGTAAAVRIHRATRAYTRGLARAAQIESPIAIRVIEDRIPKAFCAGLLRPRVYISTGAVARLEDAELRAVLAHEAHHAARRDPLRLFAAQVLAEALFFLPVMRHLRRRHAALVELAADEGAVRAIGGPQPLAAAMLLFGQADGKHGVRVTTERVDHLLRRRPGCELQVSLLLAGVLTLGGLAAVVLAAAHVTAPAQFDATMLLMQSCGPLMIALPALLLTAAMRHAGLLSHLSHTRAAEDGLPLTKPSRGAK